MKKLLPLGVLAVLAFVPLEYATNESPFKHGYINGLSDGKASARDSDPVCGGYNSTSDYNQCMHGYDLGFKKGCDLVGNRYHDSNPEYPTCYGYYSSR